MRRLSDFSQTRASHIVTNTSSLIKLYYNNKKISILKVDFFVAMYVYSSKLYALSQKIMRNSCLARFLSLENEFIKELKEWRADRKSNNDKYKY